MSDFAIACDMQAISAEQREPHEERAKSLFAAVQAVQELPDGYALRLPDDTPTLNNAILFLVNERRCCPFFRFTLDLEPEHGPVWLRMTGGEEVKAFLVGEMLSLMPPNVTWIR
jgi:hypothetical protein